MQFPINTGPKEDHPNRVAALVGVDPKYYYKAEELKLYENAINELYNLLGTANSAGNRVISYTIEWIPGTYTYKITVRKYIFNGVLHTNTIYAERTFGASDLVYNRFDSFLIDADEQIIVWPGDAVEFPYPKEFDLDTYVLINFFRVDANTTAPTGQSEILVFNEGTGAPNEWAINYLSGTLSTEHPSLDLKSIKLVNKQAVLATSPVPYEGRFLKDLLIDVTCFTAAANNRLRFSFWIADTMRVGEVYVTHGTFNFDAFLVGVPQTIVIPGSAFVNGGTWGNFQYDSLWMNNDKTGTIVYLDNVRIQQTDSEAISGTNHTHSNLSVLEQITLEMLNSIAAAANYTIDIVANQLKLYKDAVEVGSKDLSIYLDDTNLARLTSGVLNPATGIATFTRDDASTFTLDLSNLLDNQTAAEVSVDSAAFTGNLAVTDNTVQKVAEKVNTLVISGPGGTGDMVLADVQTVSGLKTFLAGKFGLRNVANTFTSFFTNANTAARTYTLPNKDGTVAMTSDIVVQMSGVVNYLVKFGTATTGVVSRLWDTGFKLGIGTAVSPSMDITLGNQGHREIGVEVSSSSIIGKNLTITAGKAINYLLDSDLISVGEPQILSGWGCCLDMTDNIIFNYFTSGNLPRQIPSGTQDVVLKGGQTYCFEIAYGFDNTAFYIKQGTNALWVNSTVKSFIGGGIFASRFSNILYMSIGGSISYSLDNGNSFTAIQAITFGVNGLCENTLGDVYGLSGGYLWKRTNGVGLFVNTGILLAGSYITCTRNNTIFTATSTNVYKLDDGSPTYSLYKSFTSISLFGLCSDSASRLFFACGGSGTAKQYLMYTEALGTDNLDGGTLKLKAGTGKGTGKSRYQIVTGQKTVSGTDMQVEIVRVEIDEDGNYTRIGTPVYADNASALAGGLTAGMEYRTATGIKMEVY